MFAVTHAQRLQDTLDRINHIDHILEESGRLSRFMPGSAFLLERWRGEIDGFAGVLAVPEYFDLRGEAATKRTARAERVDEMRDVGPVTSFDQALYLLAKGWKPGRQEDNV